MSNIKLGTNSTGFKVGSSSVSKIYLGSTSVWEPAPVTYAQSYHITGDLGHPASYSVTGTSTVTASITGAYDGRLWLLINQTGTLTYTVTASSENGYDGGRLYKTASSPTSHSPSVLFGYNASLSDLTNVSAGVTGTGTSTGTVSVTQGHYLVLRYFKDEDVNIGTDSITATLTIA